MYPMYSIAGKEAEYFKELAADRKQAVIDAERDALNREYRLGPYAEYKICPHCGAKREQS